MRIGDWSSDVCSSDLAEGRRTARRIEQLYPQGRARQGRSGARTLIMIDRIVTFSVERRWFILMMTLIVAVIGGWAINRLPIDAVPDITNNQVQVNIAAPALSPELDRKSTRLNSSH